jgi:hypothetical protein
MKDSRDHNALAFESIDKVVEHITALATQSLTIDITKLNAGDILSVRTGTLHEYTLRVIDPERQKVKISGSDSPLTDETEGTLQGSVYGNASPLVIGQIVLGCRLHFTFSSRTRGHSHTSLTFSTTEEVWLNGLQILPIVGEDTPC